MLPLGQLAPQEWLTHPETRRLMAALGARGATARFAGGCVRDAVLGLAVADIDIAIDVPPQETLALLAAAGIRAVPTGLAHGTVTAVLPGRGYEITTLRRDVETDGRHAVVAFTDDWEADAHRRDLTINALYADASGAIYDYCDGLADLGARRVRFVGEAAARISEDVLRILRFFRFHGRYGASPPDAEALAACRRFAPRVADLSGERIAQEMLKILAGADPAEVILLMRGEGVARHVLPEPIAPGRLRVLSWLETRGLVGEAADPIRRLATLLESAEAGGELAARWRLSNAQADRLAAILAADPPHAGMDRAEARRALAACGPEIWRDRVLRAWAEYRHAFGAGGSLPGSRGSAAWNALLRLPETAPVPPFPLKGADALALGVAPGPRVGELLRALEDEWRAADFAPDRAALLARLAEVVG